MRPIKQQRSNRQGKARPLEINQTDLGNPYRKKGDKDFKIIGRSACDASLRAISGSKLN
jgi:hypothetical protein